MSETTILETPDATDDAPDAATFRPLVYSAVVAGRAVHALRAGTFTDMYGRSTTFTADDLAAIAANVNPKRRLPINEQHDMGRAVGRITKVWATGDDLYFEPHWNSDGQRLLAEETYDMISVELARDPATNAYRVLIGAALTNYPAVDGLAPVRLSAPPPAVAITEPHAGGVVSDTQEQPMSESTPVVAPETPPAVTEPTVPDAAALAAQLAGLNLSQDMAARITDMVRSSVMTQFEQVRLQAEQQARAEIARFQREQEVRRLAQHMTTPTLQRQHALPLDADKFGTFLSGLSEAQRTEAIALFTQVLDAGLVSFAEIGSEQTDDRAEHERVLARVNEIVATQKAAGMSATDALAFAVNAVGKHNYNAAKAAAKGGR